MQSGPRSPVKEGDTFLCVLTDESLVEHLWIVVAVITPEFDTTLIAVLVNVTSAVGRYDTACVLVPGDHPFITAKSFVYYRAMREIPVNELVGKRPHKPCSPELLSKIRQGLQASKFASHGAKRKVPPK